MYQMNDNISLFIVGMNCVNVRACPKELRRICHASIFLIREKPRIILVATLATVQRSILRLGGMEDM